MFGKKNLGILILIITQVILPKYIEITTTIEEEVEDLENK